MLNLLVQFIRLIVAGTSHQQAHRRVSCYCESQNVQRKPRVFVILGMIEFQGDVKSAHEKDHLCLPLPSKLTQYRFTIGFSRCVEISDVNSAMQQSARMELVATQQQPRMS